jgi:hypothetical protein
MTGAAASSTDAMRRPSLPSAANGTKTALPLPLPCTLRFLSSSRALLVFLSTLSFLLICAIGLLALLQAIDPPAVIIDDGHGSSSGGNNPVAASAELNGQARGITPDSADGELSRFPNSLKRNTPADIAPVRASESLLPVDSVHTVSDPTPAESTSEDGEEEPLGRSVRTRNASAARTSGIAAAAAEAEPAEPSLVESTAEATAAVVHDAVGAVTVNNNPEINDTRITALQFLWVLSPTASTIALFFALGRFKKQHANGLPKATLIPAADGHAATTASANTAGASTLRAPSAKPPPLALVPAAAGPTPARDVDASPVDVAAPVPSRAFYTPLPSPGAAAAPTLGLEHLPKFNPLAQALLRPTASPSPGPTDAIVPPPLPPSAAEAAAAPPTRQAPNGPSAPPSAAAASSTIPEAEHEDDGDGSADSVDVFDSLADAASAVTDKVAQLAAHEPEPQQSTLENFVTVTSVCPTPAPPVVDENADGHCSDGNCPNPDGTSSSSPALKQKEDAASFVAEGADLLRRLPYLPFLGLTLPELLLETRSKSSEQMEEARKRQPWYERLGLRMLFSTHLPQPRMSLRKWIFRTRYARMQSWPRVVAFLVGAVVLPTALTSLYGLSQYLIASGSGAQGWYNEPTLAHLRKQLHLSSSHSAGGVITLGFVYEALIGCWWDIIPISSADWGNGLGFSGASWIILAFIEEFGWMGGLFPLLYYNAHMRHASAAITHRWYSSKRHRQRLLRGDGSSASPHHSNASAHHSPSSSSHSTRIDVVATPPADHHDKSTAVLTKGVRASSSSASAETDGALSDPHATHVHDVHVAGTSLHPHRHSESACEWIHVTLVCLVLGFIWSAWHWPFILLKEWLPHGVGYVPGTSDTPLGQDKCIRTKSQLHVHACRTASRGIMLSSAHHNSVLFFASSAYGFFMWVPRIVATRFVIVYFCLACGSWWGGVVYHAVHNVMVYSYWAILPDTNAEQYPFARYMHAESGITVVIGYIFTAALIVYVWKRQEEAQEARAQHEGEQQTPISAAQQQSPARSHPIATVRSN